MGEMQEMNLDIEMPEHVYGRVMEWPKYVAQCLHPGCEWQSEAHDWIDDATHDLADHVCKQEEA